MKQRGAAAVMDMSLFVLLLLSGLVCSASGYQRRYFYINQNMSWTAAQSYCRERFTDLTTVNSMDDVNMMVKAVDDGYSGSVWIGLKRGTQSRWGWSKGDDTITQYSNWALVQEFNSTCAYFAYGAWNAYPCLEILYFVCYDEMIGYVYVKMYKNWIAALQYCRQYHTDLATIRNPEEQQQLHNFVGDGPWAWIGLFSDSWEWSDQWSLFFRNWATGYPSISSGSGDCAAMSAVSGKWINASCNQQKHFICYEDTNIQIVRLKFSCDENCNLNDSSVQTAILNEIHTKLKRAKLGDYTRISWSKDERGHVFHQYSKWIERSNDTCRDLL